MTLMRTAVALSAALLVAGCGVLRGDLSTVGPQADLATSQALLNTPQGHAVELPGVDIEGAVHVPYKQVIMPGPALVFSDDPEYVRVPEGIAMQEDVDAGRVRLYVYNVNGVQEPEGYRMRISGVIENLGDEPMTIRMLNEAFPQPSGNYHFIGKMGLVEFLSGETTIPTRTVAPGEIIAIDPRMEETITSFNDLVHGFYEFLIDQPARISVVATGEDESGPDAARRVPILPHNHVNAGRGLFGVSNYRILPAEHGTAVDTATGIQQIVVADNELDPWVVGIEGTENVPIELRGNYGVMYDVRIPYTSSDGKGIAVVMYNARFGSPWCNAAAAGVTVGAGVHPAGVVAVPSNKLNTPHLPEVVLVQIFPPVPEGQTGMIELTYSPPGASCLPIPLVLIPVAMN